MVTNKKLPLRILFVGHYYLGSNARSMASALDRCGQIVQVVDPTRFIPMVKSALWLKAVRRILTPSFAREFNDQVLRDLRSFEPALMVVYKGESLFPSTLEWARQKGILCVNVFPDVSIFTHGPWLPKSLPLYNHIFTTKSFGSKDLYKHLKLTNVSFLPHGFDPEVNKVMDPAALARPALQSDVSFIGTWSPKKEAYLQAVAKTINGNSFKIWGSQWGSATSSTVKPHIMGQDIMGRVYPVALQSTKIIIALLSEARTGASSGDLITSRTFDIPACGGFMLHERTPELLDYYVDGEEVACFGSEQELVEKVRFYLDHPAERERIRLAGHRRCAAENSIDARAQHIIDWYWNLTSNES